MQNFLIGTERKLRLKKIDGFTCPLIKYKQVEKHANLFPALTMPQPVYPILPD